MVQISAHRGGSEHASPATYEAYEHVLTSGAEYAEFDIRRTGDDVLVVYHDAHIAHTGPLVAELTYKEVCDRLNYIVPKVDEVMDLLAGKMIGHLDLKEMGYEKDVIELALSILGADNFVTTTLEDSSITVIKRSFPAVRTALSLGRDLSEVPRGRWVNVRRSELFPLSRLRDCGADWAAVNYKLARLGVVKVCKRNSIGVMVWTVDSNELIDQFLIDERIDVLITNRPEYAVRRREELTLHSYRPARRPPGRAPATPLSRAGPGPAPDQQHRRDHGCRAEDRPRPYPQAPDRHRAGLRDHPGRRTRRRRRAGHPPHRHPTGA
jgi:glycerophosphoryl diester phosphodiesterase